MTTPSAPETRRTNYLPWVALGCLGGLIGTAIVAGIALFVVLPAQRAWLDPIVGRQAAAPPETPRKQGAAVSGAPEIRDDFAAPSATWQLDRARVVDGAYELRVDSANFDSYGLFLGDTAIGDLDVAVDVTQVEGPLDAEYGVRFRQPGPENYMMLSLSSGGYYRLLRVEDGVFRPIVPWTFEPGIRTGLNATNRLQLVAEGPRVRALINDREVLSVDDAGGEAGQLGMGVTAFDTAGVAVRFDNIVGRAQGQDVTESFDDAEAAPWSVGGSRIADGSYEMLAGRGIILIQQPQPMGSSRAQEFTLEVDATLVDGGDGAAYGLLFGYSENFSYYGLQLLPEGGLLLYRADPGAGRAALIEPTLVEAVRPGLNATNTIRVEVRAQRMTIAINGTTVVEEAEVGPIDGEVGMLVSSGPERGAVARFDNFHFTIGGRRT